MVECQVRTDKTTNYSLDSVTNPQIDGTNTKLNRAAKFNAETSGSLKKLQDRFCRENQSRTAQ